MINNGDPGCQGEIRRRSVASMVSADPMIPPITAELIVEEETL
jgi:hypothetical protein